MRAILLSVLLVVGAFAQIPTDACSLCTSLVDGLESYSSFHSPKTRENLLKGLETLQSEICSKIPSSNPYFTSQQCSDYVSLYGSYLVDLFLSSTTPSNICGTLGLCTVQPDQNAYEVLLPTITNQSVEYDFPDTKLTAGQKMLFKIFLGSPAFLNEEVLFVQLKRKVLSACAISMEITNKTNYEKKVFCGQNTTACSCNDLITKPGRGVWYYISVVNEQILDASQECSFSLHAIVENERTFHHMIAYHANVIILLVPLFFCCICCCCCCMLRRRYRRGVCRYQCSRRGSVNPTESGVAIDMQPMSVGSNMVNPNMPATPMGYYYVPTGAYVPLPQTAQPVAYPQFVAVQQE